MKKYKGVILGCGPRAYNHAIAYKYVANGELVACCDLVKDKMKKFSDEFKIRGYSDAKEMIRKEKPDLIHIVTPPHVRVPLMELVDTEGVPACIVEKPVACEVKDWLTIVKLEENSNTKFAVGQQVRFQTFLQKCREAIVSNKIGKLEHIDFSAGMNISGQGTHILDWAMYLNNDEPITRVFGAASGTDMADMQHPAPDTTLAQVLFANGVYGTWNNGYSARRVIDDEAVWKHLRIAAYAQKGHVLFEEFGKWEIFSSDGLEQGITDMQIWAEMNHEAQARLTDSMFIWLDDDTKPSGTNLKKILHQWNAVLGLYASALWRKPVDIPFEPPIDLFSKLYSKLSDDS